MRDNGWLVRATFGTMKQTVRGFCLRQTCRRWTRPRSFPARVHLEGTQMSEGRGTTRPFELVGAPYIDAGSICAGAEWIGPARRLLSVLRFSCRPFKSMAGEACGGVQIHVTNRETFPAGVGSESRSSRQLSTCTAIEFKWKNPPYEYEYDKNPFDVIAGTSKVREAIERGDSLDSIKESWQDPSG